LDFGIADFSVSALAASFLFGVIGLWMFREGRRRDHTVSLGIGLAMMIYPYFVSQATLTWLIGFALCGAAYYYWNR
jgi:hypothetical protein